MTDWKQQALTAVQGTNKDADAVVALAVERIDGEEGFAYVRMASEAAREVAVALLEKTDPLAIPVIRKVLEWTDESSAVMRHLRDTHNYAPSTPVRPRDLGPLHESVHADEGTPVHEVT